jgi:AMP nucleosidase
MQTDQVKLLLDKINFIYHQQNLYPKLIVKRHWSKDNPVISGELSVPSAYSFYLKRQLNNLLQLGAEISVEPTRRVTNSRDGKILDYVDEQHLDLRNKKIFLFSPERIEISVERLRHYTGTEVEDFQSRILMTNYPMHMEVFAEIFPDCIKPKAANVQMPAYHHVLPDNQGITIVNIGVGATNAKTFTDHVCVLKPDLMLMIGHCGGLRNNQKLGDYVLANSYLRDDKVLDDILPLKIPVVPNPVLTNIIMDILHEDKVDYRIGCVFTTSDRNWEFRKTAYMKDFALSRSVAIDMESATVAANGYRYRVPNATLLAVSDKPLHGELKRTQESAEFYNNSKKRHVELAIQIVNKCKELYPQGFPTSVVRGLYDPLMISV